MFTGIIQDIGTVTSLSPHQGGGFKAKIRTKLTQAALVAGASIACNGACLTVVEPEAGQFSVDVSPETVSRTSLKDWKAGARMNLEAALKMGDALDGHIVTGHVDALATLSSITPDGNSYKVIVTIPAELQKFVAEKGSVTLDGVSLTVNKVKDPAIELMIIPHTWQQTCFQFYKAGDFMNLEIDILARYVARLQQV